MFMPIGPSLPSRLGYRPALITSPDGKGVILVGGFKRDQVASSNELLEFRQSTGWTVLSQKLKYARQFPVVLPISNDLTSCKSSAVIRTGK